LVLQQHTACAVPFKSFSYNYFLGAL
jgi:hypothetical protein